MNSQKIFRLGFDETKANVISVMICQVDSNDSLNFSEREREREREGTTHKNVSIELDDIF